MLYVTSSRTDSPERILIARESGRSRETDNNTAYRFAADEVSFMTAAQRLTETKSVLYAIRLSDGLIKIGWTSNLLSRWRWLKTRQGAHEFLAFTFGTREDEGRVHRCLADHVARGREYYHPTPEVLAVVNGWRTAIGREPLAA